MNKIILLILLLIIMVLIIRNNIIKKENNIENAYSSLDVYLKKRYDLIPNLVKCVKAYMTHEKEVLEEIVKLRDKNDLNKLEKDLAKIIIESENYPELKSSDNFIKLQEQLNEIEDEISAARRTYNAHINNYNIYINKFPIIILSRILGYEKKQLFKITKEEKDNRNWMNNNEK